MFALPRTAACWRSVEGVNAPPRKTGFSRPAQDAAALRPPARDGATALLRDLSGELALLGVTELWLFGSVARGDDHERSDLDIAVRTVDRFDIAIRFDVQDFLQAQFGRHVDLTTLPMDERLASVAAEDLVKVF